MSNSEGDIPSPTWRAWSGAAEYDLWAAVALVCNIEPDAIVRDPFGAPAVVRTATASTTALPSEFSDLLFRANSEFPSKYGRQHGPLVRRFHRPVRLDAFGTWAAKAGWILPERFPREESEHPVVSDSPPPSGLPRGSAAPAPGTVLVINNAPVMVASADAHAAAAGHAPTSDSAPEPSPHPKASGDSPSATTRQRRTLLVIIEALCRSKKPPFDTQKRGAAKEIADMTEALGAPIGEETIKALLDGIPDAISSRKTE